MMNFSEILLNKINLGYQVACRILIIYLSFDPLAQAYSGAGNILAIPNLELKSLPTLL
ncbi:MAG: hypothetical protein Q7S81_01760 [bacterium]|nr:hypothetical protein [bacterium]